MSKIRWYKRDPVAWLHGTRKLTLEERGAYADIIELIMSHDGRIEDNDADIAAWLRCHWRTWKAIKLRLIEFGKISIEDGWITNRRCSMEAEAALRIIDAASDAGRASGAARRLRSVKDPPQEVSKTPLKKCQRPSQEPSTTEQKSIKSDGCDERPFTKTNEPTTTTTTTTTTTIDPDIGVKTHTTRARKEVPEGDFDVWYAAYPRHVGKGQAKRAYASAVARASPADLLSGAERLSDHCARNGVDERYIPHPATWLNGDRWLDELSDNNHTRNYREPRSKARECIELIEMGFLDGKDCTRKTDGMPSSVPGIQRSESRRYSDPGETFLQATVIPIRR